MSDGGFGVQFIGLSEAFFAMGLWTKELGPAIEEAALGFGEFVADATAAQVPVLTGALQASVTAESSPDGVSVSIGEDLPYAGWIEFGGSRGRAYVPEGRYLYPTARAATPEWEAFAIKVAIETVGSFPWPIPVF